MKHLEFMMPSSFNIFLFGDMHLGSRYHYEQGVDRLIQMMHHPYADCKNNFGWHHGDAIECITVDDKRFNLQQNKEHSILKQMEAHCKKMKKLGKRLLGQNTGNHEKHNWRFGNITEDMCKEMGIAYGTYTSKIHYISEKTGNSIFKHYATHGYGCISSSNIEEREARFAMERGLRKRLYRKADDCLLMTMGHTHKLLSVKPIERLLLVSESGHLIATHNKGLRADGTIEGEARWYGNTGSFMRTMVEGYEGYGEQAGYDPIEMGFLICRVRGGIIEGLDEISVGC